MKCVILFSLLVASLTYAMPNRIALADDLNLGDVSVKQKITYLFPVSVSGSSGASMEDLYLLTDATGSMFDAIDTSRRQFLNLVAARTAASADVAFGVGFYRDELDVPFRNLESITKDTARVNRAIGTLTADGGFDGEEANLWAISQVATNGTIGWRKSSRKILVYFGDWPGHEPTCPGGKPLFREDVIRQLNARGITVVASSFSPGLDFRTSSADSEQGSFSCGFSRSFRGNQATDITAATGGKVADVADQAMVIDSIIGTVKGLPQTLEADTSKCSKTLSIKFRPSLPLKINAGSTRNVKMRVTIKKKACLFAKDRTLRCTIKYTLGGAAAGEQQVYTDSVSGC